MDESKKQKILIGALLVLVAAVLAINFWPSGSPTTPVGDEEQQVVTQAPKPAAREAQEIQKSRQPVGEEEEAAPTRRAGSTEEEPIKRSKGKPTGKEAIPPVS